MKFYILTAVTILCLCVWGYVGLNLSHHKQEGFHNQPTLTFTPPVARSIDDILNDAVKEAHNEQVQ